MRRKAHCQPVKEPTLSELLSSVQERFAGSSPNVYSFTLGTKGGGWVFKVVNSWQRWTAANRQHEFGPHPTPEAAVRAFLDYVKEHRIDVSGLQD